MQKEGIQFPSHAVAWWLWKHQNTCVFDEASPSIIRIIKTFKRMQTFGVWQGLLGLGHFGHSSVLFRL
jgi:hypothetical protein